MNDPDRTTLMRQFDLAWQLAWYHLETVSDEECLWRPADRGLHVHQAPDGTWRADWPQREAYDIGPPSIAWLTWHMLFWWSMVLNHTFADASLTRERVQWPGGMDAVRTALTELRDRWQAAVAQLSAADLDLPRLTRWPFQDRPFADVIAWLNVELVKNAAEIGYARFLYACRKGVS